MKVRQGDSESRTPRLRISHIFTKLNKSINLPYSEQQIRGLALNFLRRHYAMRPRSGTSGTETETRKRFYNGVTIDARLAFQKPDLSRFVATVEATSVDRADEILYRVNWFRIGVHASLAALAVMTLVLAGTQVRWWVEEAVLNPAQFFALMTSVLVLLTGVFAFALSFLKYYRYIYAVAQFQQFHADAQWIAYDREIFPITAEDDADNPRWTKAEKRRNDWLRKRYQELVRQVTRFGFGLMEMREEGKVRWIIEPSHIDQFQGKRGQLPLWIQTIQAPPLMQRLNQALPFRTGGAAARPVAPAAAPKVQPVPTDGETDPLALPAYLPTTVRVADYVDAMIPARPGSPKPWQQPRKELLRLRWRLRHFVRSFYPKAVRNQVAYHRLPWAVVAAWLILFVAFGVLLTVALNRDGLSRPNQRQAAPPVAAIEGGAPAAEDPLLPGEYDHTRRAGELRPGDEALADPQLRNSLDGNERAIDRWTIDTDGGVNREYQCLSFALLTDKYYLVRAGQYPDFFTARAAALALHRRTGLAVTVSRTSCVRIGGGGYGMYLGDPTTDAAVADFLERGYEGEYGLTLEVVETRPGG